MNVVRVLVVDDSPSMRLMLNHVLELDERIKVLATVNDGQAAIDYLAAGSPRPDVVLMDIHMPRIDGFETTRHIMETNPLPIVICTATADPQEMQVAFRSMEAGAVACVEKPVGYDDPQFDATVQNLQQTVRLMAEVKVIRRWPKPRLAGGRASAAPSPVGRASAPRIVGIGASTGGPPVLQNILSSLTREFPAPVLIVQHIARGFLPGMVEWLNQTTGLHVHVAAHGAVATPGHVYIAPDDFHLGVGSAGRLLLTRAEPAGGHRPAVTPHASLTTWGSAGRAGRSTPATSPTADFARRSRTCSAPWPRTSAPMRWACCSRAWGATAPRSSSGCATAAR